ncbi:hypothetical protein [Pseudodesulfovibrio methanolicus]|uniref:Uncharacterized protein n=1 Tax=Pseudodesulfovibrio methanolicus TaxID=3126690 RepID=A0ABZ2IZ96_9BACT
MAFTPGGRPGSPWFLRAEDAWRAAQRRIGGVLRTALGRMRAEPLPFVVGVACLYMWTLAFKLLPLSRLDGAYLYAVAWSWSALGALLDLALVVVVAGAVLRGEGERGFFGPDFPRRFLRALPYAFCYYVCFGQAWGLLGWGVQWLAEPVFGGNSVFLWTASYTTWGRCRCCTCSAVSGSPWRARPRGSASPSGAPGSFRARPPGPCS